MEELRDKVRGAIVGVAIGDALGMPVEGLLPTTIQKHFGQIKTYRTPNPKCRSPYHSLKRGQWTDDTQLTIAIGESIVAKKGIDYDDIAAKHVEAFQGSRRGWGKATVNGCQKLLTGAKWWESGQEGAAGNGPPMKVAPIGVLYGLDIIDKFGLVTICTNISKMTHGDPRAAVAAACQAYLVGTAIKNNINGVIYTIQGLSDFAESIESSFYERDVNGIEFFYEKLFQSMILVNNTNDKSKIRSLIGVKSFVNESVVFTYAMLFKHGNNLQSCMEEIINQGGDADTTGALAGSILGAAYGYSKFPERWRWGLEERAKLIKLADNLFDLSKKKD